MTTQNIFDLTDTWNDGGTTFTALKMNVTDTASDAASLLMDLQVGSSSLAAINKTSGRLKNSPTGSYYNGTFQSENYGGVFFQAASSGGGSLSGIGGTYRGVQIFQEGAPVISSAAGYPVTIGNTLGLGFWNTSDNTRRAADVILVRDAANTLALRNSTNAQTFNLYNTYTDASNYERGFMRFSSNTLEIGTEAAGTGSNRNLVLKTSGGSVTLNAISGSLGASGPIIQSGTSAYHQMTEMASPPSGVANRGTVYVEDNGSGKTRLMVVFGSGAAQQIAIEP